MEIKVLHQVMEWNEDVSAQVRETLAGHGIFMINIMGSPGTGKTSLITSLIQRLRPRWRIGVIEGDIAGQIDAERITALGVPAVQLNTDGACHIEAMSIQHILPYLPLEELDVIFVENIGNLVCPAEFDIGENLRITILSVPEGDDKVEKYPLMFTDTGCLILNKWDCRDYFSFDAQRVRLNYEAFNPGAPLFTVSCRTGEGLDAVCRFLDNAIESARSGSGFDESGSGFDGSGGRFDGSGADGASGIPAPQKSRSGAAGETAKP